MGTPCTRAYTEVLTPERSVFWHGSFLSQLVVELSQSGECLKVLCLALSVGLLGM